MLFKTTVLDAHELRCPNCNYKADAASSESGKTPIAGAVAVCYNCAAINMYTGEGSNIKLLPLSVKQFKYLERNHPEAFRKLMSQQAYILSLINNRTKRQKRERVKL